MDSAKTATLAFPQHPLCDWKGHCQKHTNIFLNVVDEDSPECCVRVGQTHFSMLIDSSVAFMITPNSAVNPCPCLECANTSPTDIPFNLL